MDALTATEGEGVVVAEDDERTARFLADNLAADGFRVWTAAGAAEALRTIEARAPAFLLLDLILADGDGLLLLDRIRSADGLARRIDPELPVLVLSGRAGEADRVRGLARGADDYMVKPFSYAELLARMRAILRRSGQRRARGVLRVGELVIDPAAREVRLGERRVHLTVKEFALLHMLATDPSRVFSKDELLRDVWGYRASGRTRTVDAHVYRLRAKLAGEGRPWVVSARGVGYRLVDPA